MNCREIRLTVSELQEMLSHFSEDAEISFGTVSDAAPLSFHRLKSCGEKELRIDLAQIVPSR